MSEEKSTRLGLAARKFNISSTSVVDFLATKGHKIDANPNSKITSELMGLLEKEFASSEQEKKEASELKIGNKHQNIPPVVTEATSKLIQKNPLSEGIFGKNQETEQQETIEEKEVIITSNVQLPGIKVLGKIDLNAGKTPKQESKPAKAVESKVQNTVVETPKVAETPKVEEQSKTEVVENKVEAPKNIEKAPKEEAKSVIKQDNKVSAPIVETKEPVKADQPISEETIEKVVSILKTDDISSLDESTIDSLPEEVKMQLIEAKADKLQGLTVLGKIELPVEKKPKPNEHHQRDRDKKKRKRLKDGPVVSTSNQNNNNNNFVKKGGPNNPQQGNNPHHQNNQNRGNFNQNQPNAGGPNNKPADNNNRQNPAQGAPKSVGNKFSNNTSTSGTPHQTGDRNNQGGKGPRNKFEKPEVNKSEVEGNIKNTMAKLGGGQKAAFANRTKYKKEKRSFKAEQREKRQQEEDAEAKILKVSEFVSANDLASMMDVSVNEVISTCMSLGMFVSINQRLDAEAIAIIADEFEFEVQFISAEAEEEEAEVIVDSPEDLENRAPIVTIMGHVDHGKTSLLDYIRKANIVASEAGGITQHIGAYDVKTQSGKRIAFLDTPGHEAFTAMRARGAKITDIVIIVVAADDDVMPQTKEAINHALNAGVPIVIAINKIDKPNANPDKIKEALSKENILVEEWGGKYQCQEISAKKGTGVEDLLEKVLLEAELLDLKANPNKAAKGTVIEASLDKGRGYVSTIMIQEGTLKIGDIILAGHHFGRVRAMLDHKSKKLKEAGPSTPVVLLGLSGAPQAGDSVKVMESEREAREIATRREQIIREQSIRTKKHITLDEIGRRLAIGNFKQLNIIIKGDVDGSVEALTDSLLKLSTEEVAVSIVHKGVGQISESDVLLASAADAIILGFQVRPSQNARKLAETEEIEIRHYSIIYDAIEEVKSAMEGMLEPKKEEVIVGTVDVRAVFKISKVGTVAGCYVLSGHVKRSLNIRLVRDGIVMHDGRIDQLKRIKEDVSEVKSGYECGISIKGFNDIQEGDTIEVYEEREIKRKL